MHFLNRCCATLSRPSLLGQCYIFHICHHRPEHKSFQTLMLEISFHSFERFYGMPLYFYSAMHIFWIIATPFTLVILGLLMLPNLYPKKHSYAIHNHRCWAMLSCSSNLVLCYTYSTLVMLIRSMLPTLAVFEMTIYTCFAIDVGSHLHVYGKPIINQSYIFTLAILGPLPLPTLSLP